MKVVDLENPIEPLKFEDCSFIDRATQDYIRQFKNTLTADECQEIIGMYKHDDWQELESNGDKLCDVVGIGPGKIDDLLMDKFSKLMYSYAKDYPRAASFSTDIGYTLIRSTVEHHCPIHHEPSGAAITAIIATIGIKIIIAHIKIDPVTFSFFFLLIFKVKTPPIT